MNPAPKHSSRDEPPPRGTIEQQAADWLSRRDRGFLSGEQEAFSAWLLEDPRHAAAAKHIEASLRFLQKPRFSGQTEDILREIDARVLRRTRRRRFVWLSTFGLAAAVLIVLILRPTRLPEIAAPVATGSIQVKPDRRTLPDGSVVELNSAADIEVEFTPSRRNVLLRGGTALFIVAKDSTRPFIVTTGGISVQAIGTQFCVRSDAREVDVIVTEGRVAVDAPPPGMVSAGAASLSPTAQVNAGYHVVVPLNLPATALQVQPTTPQMVQAALAWQTMRVEFTDLPLSDVVKLFNQQNALQLDLDYKARDTRISGIYWLDDPEGFSRVVATIAGLEASPHSKGRIILRPR